MKYLDNGHWRVTGKEASQLAASVHRTKPKDGMQLCVRVDISGRDVGNAWLSRSPHNGRLVWVILPVSSEVADRLVDALRERRSEERSSRRTRKEGR